MSKECCFCKETNCIASGQFETGGSGESYICDIRLDLEFNQIDAEFGLLVKQPNGTVAVNTNWTSALDINYCPVCGRELPKEEY